MLNVFNAITTIKPTEQCQWFSGTAACLPNSESIHYIGFIAGFENSLYGLWLKPRREESLCINIAE